MFFGSNVVWLGHLVVWLFVWLLSCLVIWLGRLVMGEFDLEGERGKRRVNYIVGWFGCLVGLLVCLFDCLVGWLVA